MANGALEAELTPWFERGVKPVRVGRYRTSRADIASYGSAYSWWNGVTWEPFESWGAYHDSLNFIWRGLRKS